MSQERATIKITPTKIKQQCTGVWLESGTCQAISLLKSKDDAQLQRSLCCNVDPCDWWKLIFCKVAGNTDLGNTEPSLLGEIQGQVAVSLWSHFHQLVST